MNELDNLAREQRLLELRREAELGGVVVGEFLAEGFQLGDQVGGGGAVSHALEEQRR